MANDLPVFDYDEVFLKFDNFEHCHSHLDGAVSELACVTTPFKSLGWSEQRIALTHSDAVELVKTVLEQDCVRLESDKEFMESNSFEFVAAPSLQVKGGLAIGVRLFDPAKRLGSVFYALAVVVRHSAHQFIVYSSTDGL